MSAEGPEGLPRPVVYLKQYPYEWGWFVYKGAVTLTFCFTYWGARWWAALYMKREMAKIPKVPTIEVIPWPDEVMQGER